MNVNREHCITEQSAVSISSSDGGKVSPIDRLAEEDRALLASLAKPLRSQVEKRVVSLTRLADEEVSVKDAVADSGMSRTSFHRLRHSWSPGDPIDVLVPYMTRAARTGQKGKVGSALAGENTARDNVEGKSSQKEPARKRVGGSDEQTGLKACARELAIADPAATNGELARRLVETMPKGTASVRTATVLFQRMRREMRRDPDNIRINYGSQIVADFTAIDMTIAGPDDDEPALASFIVERSTSLILGAGVAYRSRALAMQKLTLLEARNFIGRERIDVSSQGPVRMQFVLGEGDSGETFWLDHPHSISANDLRIEFIADGPRRFGRRLIATVGPRIGRLVIRSGSTSISSSAKVRPNRFLGTALDLNSANALVNLEVEKWNAPILDLIRSTIPSEELSEAGAMIQALDAAEAHLFLRKEDILRK
ncbi:MAG: hypothetical protein WA908_02195 [Pontixanthobacter sp.]